MPKKRSKPVSFDAMVKFFMHTYNIPTKKDVDRLVARLDRIERLLATAESAKSKRGGGARSSGKENTITASDIVLEVIQRCGDGIGFAEIQQQTGFSEKKLRNIIFRLHNLGKIRRKSRGVYMKA
jgi:hypothetical protein